MSKPEQNQQQSIRELAYAFWEQEGRPEGRELAHWELALAARGSQRTDSPLQDEAEAPIDGNPSVDFQALPAKDIVKPAREKRSARRGPDRLIRSA